MRGYSNPALLRLSPSARATCVQWLEVLSEWMDDMSVPSDAVLVCRGHDWHWFETTEACLNQKQNAMTWVRREMSIWFGAGDVLKPWGCWVKASEERTAHMGTALFLLNWGSNGTVLCKNQIEGSRHGFGDWVLERRRVAVLNEDKGRSRHSWKWVGKIWNPTAWDNRLVLGNYLCLRRGDQDVLDRWWAGLGVDVVSRREREKLWAGLGSLEEVCETKLSEVRPAL